MGGKPSTPDDIEFNAIVKRMKEVRPWNEDSLYSEIYSDVDEMRLFHSNLFNVLLCHIELFRKNPKDEKNIRNLKETLSMSFNPEHIEGELANIKKVMNDPFYFRFYIKNRMESNARFM